MTWNAAIMPDDALPPDSLVGRMLNPEPECDDVPPLFPEDGSSLPVLTEDVLAASERAERDATVNSMPRLPSDKDLDDWISECAELTRSGNRGHYWAFEVGADDVRDIVRAALARWA